MKFVPVLLLVFTTAFSQNDTVTLKHLSYSTTFDRKLGYPIKVEWWITKKSLSCQTKIKRTDNFGPDPELESYTDLQKHYANNGYDRGHNFPAADGACNKQSMEESFYFSNMTPQTHQLNRGDWKLLEIWCRELALERDSIKVFSGSVGSIKKIGNVHVPKQCWKVVYVKKSKQYHAFLFNNDDSRSDGIDDNRVKLEKIQALSGFKFQ